MGGLPQAVLTTTAGYAYDYLAQQYVVNLQLLQGTPTMPKSTFEQAYKLATFIVATYFADPDSVTVKQFAEIVAAVQVKLDEN
jgi:hypothetical protein